MNQSYLNQLLSSKLPDSTEVEIHLFEYCNLNCAFCGQDHDSTVGMDRESILDKAVEIIKFFIKSNQTKHTINIMGGEIFNDEIPDELFSHYREFRSKIVTWVNDNGHEVRFNWVTNLIFRKLDRVVKFIDECEHSYISTSYDFSGRGLDINKSLLFKRNLDILGDYITVIGFVLTRPAIRKILSDSDKGFKELYSKYTLYFDYYVPELSADKLMPSDEELLEVFQFVADNYPEVYPIKDWLVNRENKMTCYSLNKLTLLPDGREVKCRYMDYDDDAFDTPIDYSSNENIIEAHLNRNECLQCEFFDRCGFRCFVQADWAKLKRLDECFLRKFFLENPLHN